MQLCNFYNFGDRLFLHMKPIATSWPTRLIATLESLLMKSANGDSCLQELSDMKESIFSKDVCVDRLENQLRMLVDVIRVELPEVKKVTSIRTICDAMAQHVNKNLLSEVHLLLRLYLTIPITSSTSERSFPHLDDISLILSRA